MDSLHPAPADSKGESRQSSPESTPDDDRVWFVRIDESFWSIPVKALPERCRSGLVALEFFARLKDHVWVGDDKIAKKCGRQETSINQILQDLEDRGWIRRVYAHGDKPSQGRRDRRVGIILLKRTHPDSPAADTPEAVAKATSILRGRAKPTQQNFGVRVSQTAESESVKRLTELDSPELNEVKKNVPNALRFAGGEENPTAKAQKTPSEIREAEPDAKPRTLSRPLPEGAKRLPVDALVRRIHGVGDEATGDEIDSVAGDVAATLGDGDSFSNWVTVIGELSRKELTPHAVATAIEAGLKKKGGKLKARKPAAVAMGLISKARANDGKLPAEPFPEKGRRLIPDSDDERKRRYKDTERQHDHHPILTDIGYALEAQGVTLEQVKAGHHPRLDALDALASRWAVRNGGSATWRIEAQRELYIERAGKIMASEDLVLDAVAHVDTVRRQEQFQADRKAQRDQEALARSVTAEDRDADAKAHQARLSVDERKRQDEEFRGKATEIWEKLPPEEQQAQMQPYRRYVHRDELIIRQIVNGIAHRLKNGGPPLKREAA